MRAGWLPLLIVLTACSRASESPLCPTCAPPPDGAASGGAGGGSGGSGPAPDAGGLPVEADVPGVVPFRQLSRLELANSLRDLFGSPQPEADLYPADAHALTRFRAGSDLGLSPFDVEKVGALAEGVAARAVLDPVRLLPCNPLPTAADQQEQCARQFIAGFGLRAFRRPLEEPEQAALLEVYQFGRSAEAAGDFLGGIRLVIEAMLQSPLFLYRWEVSPPLAGGGPLVPLGPYEMASRLSYGFWTSMPDEALFAAAARNELSTPEQLENQARRLLADPRARDMVLDFFGQLLRTDELLSVEKAPAFAFSADVARSIQAETRAFLDDLMLRPGAAGTLEDLLTSPFTFVDGNLARIYGVAPPPAGMVRTKLDQTRRGGVLTQLAFLSANATPEDTSVVRRGLTIFESVLCRQLPAPPTDVPAPVEPPANATTRERYEAVIGNGCTLGCHPIYPLGWAFQNYDAIGAFRTTEPGSPKVIDASGSIPAGTGELTWKTPLDLIDKLSRLAETRECLNKQWFRYLLRRMEEPGDAASLATSGSSFGRSHSLRELALALVRTRAFSHRTVSPGEAP
jgi:hypothetical protein